MPFPSRPHGLEKTSLSPTHNIQFNFAFKSFLGPILAIVLKETRLIKIMAGRHGDMFVYFNLISSFSYLGKYTAHMSETSTKYM